MPAHPKTLDLGRRRLTPIALLACVLLVAAVLGGCTSEPAKEVPPWPLPPTPAQARYTPGQCHNAICVLRPDDRGGLPAEWTPLLSVNETMAWPIVQDGRLAWTAGLIPQMSPNGMPLPSRNATAPPPPAPEQIIYTLDDRTLHIVAQMGQVRLGFAQATKDGAILIVQPSDATANGLAAWTQADDKLAYVPGAFLHAHTVAAIDLPWVVLNDVDGEGSNTIALNIDTGGKGIIAHDHVQAVLTDGYAYHVAEGDGTGPMLLVRTRLTDGQGDIYDLPPGNGIQILATKPNLLLGNGPIVRFDPATGAMADVPHSFTSGCRPPANGGTWLASPCQRPSAGTGITSVCRVLNYETGAARDWGAAGFAVDWCGTDGTHFWLQLRATAGAWPANQSRVFVIDAPA